MTSTTGRCHRANNLQILSNILIVHIDLLAVYCDSRVVVTRKLPISDSGAVEPFIRFCIVDLSHTNKNSSKLYL